MLRILNRLKIWQKLLLVGVACVVLMSKTTYDYVEAKQYKIDFANAELDGDAYLRPVSRLLGGIAAHKSIVRRRLAGDPGLETSIADLERAIDQHLIDLATVHRRLGGSLDVDRQALTDLGRDPGAHPDAIARSWTALRATPGTVEASDAAHERLLADAATLFAHVGDTSKLILDPDLDTYYVMDALLLQQPELLRKLAAMGDTVDDILRRGTITVDERIQLGKDIAFAQFRAGSLKADVATAVANTPKHSKHATLGSVLTIPTADVAAATDDLAIATSSLGTGMTLWVSREKYRALVDRAMGATARLWPLLMDQEDVMLSIRRQGDLDTRWWALFWDLVAVVLAVVMTILIMRSIAVPLRRATAVAEQLARGELPDKVDVGKASDETGQLLHAINSMLQFLALKKTIASLQASGKLLSGAVGDLDRNTQEQVSATVRQAAALQETQITTQEIKQTSRLAAEKAAAVLAVVARAEAISDAGEAAIEATIGGLTEVRTHADEIMAKVIALNQRAQQISVITQTVKDLADQSNMLALNAAIEAVRSGEHGKGFAVVAREIRNLADQSIQATNRVNEILQNVSSSIHATVQIADTGRQRMEAGISQVRASGESLRELSTIVRDSSHSVRQIAAAVSQQDVGISQIFLAVSDQSQLMDDTVKRAEASASTVDALKEVAVRVDEVVSRFRA